jgi:hypothetical protein
VARAAWVVVPCGARAARDVVGAMTTEARTGATA